MKSQKEQEQTIVSFLTKPPCKLGTTHPTEVYYEKLWIMSIKLKEGVNKAYRSDYYILPYLQERNSSVGKGNVIITGFLLQNRFHP
jgi:hypothetical protein